MFLLPLIQLSQGECVDPFPEPSEGEALPLTHPAEVAHRFQGIGAVGLHVVDVDAALGKPPNDEALLSILDAVRIPVQAAGGVRSLKRIQELHDTGVQRVVVGTMGVLHPDWLEEASKCFPRGLLVNLDEKGGYAWIKGRTQDSGQRVEDLATRFDQWGFEGIVITQLNGTGPKAVGGLAPRLKTPVMLQSPFRTEGDLLAAREAGVRGAILGHEIYDRTLDFEALNKTFKTL